MEGPEVLGELLAEEEEAFQEGHQEEDVVAMGSRVGEGEVAFEAVLVVAAVVEALVSAEDLEEGFLVAGASSDAIPKRFHRNGKYENKVFRMMNYCEAHR